MSVLRAGMDVVTYDPVLIFNIGDQDGPK